MTSSPDQSALGVGVSEALEGLDDLDALPVAAHVERFDALHEALAAALSGIDEV